MTERPPKVFISYSHDSQSHKDWVRTLATRLVNNGVDVILDQWNLTLGGDLPRFMESGLSDADRVLAICSKAYVQKATAGQGGVGYEKMILTAQLMQDVTSDRIIPVIRENEGDGLVPLFLLSRIYVDFRNDACCEEKYAELIQEIHGEKILPRPPLGSNPFRDTQTYSTPNLSVRPERYVSAALFGIVTFDYSNNNGRYVLGTGDQTFETAWSAGSSSSIHAYTDPPSIRTLALITNVSEIADIVDSSIYDTSSRVRSPHLGDIVVWQNTAGYFAATRIEKLKSRSHGDLSDEITFSYVIQSNRTPSFNKQMVDAQQVSQGDAPPVGGFES